MKRRRLLGCLLLIGVVLVGAWALVPRPSVLSPVSGVVLDVGQNRLGGNVVRVLGAALVTEGLDGCWRGV